jgi:hypothetical protein
MSIPKSHFREKHPEYVSARRKIYWTMITAMLIPIATLAAEVFIFGIATQLSSMGGLPAIILFLSFLPLVPASVYYTSVNGKFRRAWVSTHGKHESNSTD